MSNPSQKTTRAGGDASTSIVIATATGLAIAAGQCQVAQAIRIARITLTALAIATTDATTSGAYGSQKLFDFPEGFVRTMGCLTNFTAITVAAGLSATATVKHALGSVAVSASDTLSSTLADILPSTSSVMVASAGTGYGTSTSDAYLDGTAAAKSCFLNIGVADAGTTSNSTVTLTGTVTVHYMVIGDR